MKFKLDIFHTIHYRMIKFILDFRWVNYVIFIVTHFHGLHPHRFNWHILRCNASRIQWVFMQTIHSATSSSRYIAYHLWHFKISLHGAKRYSLLNWHDIIYVR